MITALESELNPAGVLRVRFESRGVCGWTSTASATGVSMLVQVVSSGQQDQDRLMI